MIATGAENFFAPVFCESLLKLFRNCATLTAETTFIKEGLKIMEQTMNTTVLRQTNRRRVFQYIYHNTRPVTKQEIAGELSLSLPTVTGNLAELLEEGLVSCSGTQESTGGRKPRTYTLVAGARTSVGVSIRDDAVQLMAMDMRGAELAFQELPVTFSHTSEYYQKISQSLEDFIDGCGLDRDRMLGVGISIPGIIDQAEGRLVMSPTLELWDVQLEEIYCHFSRYSTFIENTPNSSGYAERWMDNEQTNVVYLSLDRGVGGAIIQGDKQYLGDHGRGGEFGHMRLVPNGRLCHCGRRGCVEAYCSTSRLSDDLGLTLDEFFARLRAGEEQAVSIWEEYRTNLTDTLVNLRTCFDCDIILGGSLSPYLEGLLPEICWEVGEKALFDGDNFFLRLDRFGPHSACAGTALRFIDDFLLTY